MRFNKIYQICSFQIINVSRTESVETTSAINVNKHKII